MLIYSKNFFGCIHASKVIENQSCTFNMEVMRKSGYILQNKKNGNLGKSGISVFSLVFAVAYQLFEWNNI